MANIPKFVKAKERISSYFNQRWEMVYRIQELQTVFYNNKTQWQLSNSMTFDSFTESLQKAGILTRNELELHEANNMTGTKVLFSRPGSTPLMLASGLYPKAYLSHFTALFLNNLTEQIPKKIYVTNEQSKKPFKGTIASQQAIDNAFAKEQKVSETFAVFEGTQISILTGKNTQRLGVYTDNDNINYTNVYRTLIDATVRPAYSGGPQVVLNSFKNALDQTDFSINKFTATLKRMDFVYPYHQAIGFYMERAGYPTRYLDAMRLPMPYKFYLNYGMQYKEYDSNWKIFYPKGM